MRESVQEAARHEGDHGVEVADYMDDDAKLH